MDEKFSGNLIIDKVDWDLIDRLFGAPTPILTYGTEFASHARMTMVPNSLKKRKDRTKIKAARSTGIEKCPSI